MSECQFKDVLFPFFLKGVHIFGVEDRFQGFVTGGVLFVVSVELVVELCQKIFLLQVIAEITGLGIICARVFVVELV